MHSLKFWQKTYLLTLSFFLIALFSGMLFIGWHYQHQSQGVLQETALNDHRYIVQRLSDDLESMTEVEPVKVSNLASYYGILHAQNGVLIQASKDDVVLFSNLPTDSDLSNLEFQQSHQSWIMTKTDEGMLLLVASPLAGAFEEYRIVIGYPAADTIESQRQMNKMLLTGFVLASIVLAVGLFFILRSLTRPLEKLAKVADEFAAGNFDARADEERSDEIGELATSLNGMADAAVSNMDEIQAIAERNERIAANLSHEIRTPLTTIKGYAEYLRIADPSGEERDSALVHIITESQRLHNLSKQMLKLSTLNHETMPIERFDVREPLERAIHSVRINARDSEISLEGSPLPNAEIMGDSILIESLFLNIFANALTACSPTGSIKTSMRIRSDSDSEDSIGEMGNTIVLCDRESIDTRDVACIYIQDNGCGFAQEELDRLGEAFYRPDNSRSRELGGAGLGIALCRQIVEHHQGRLVFQSQPGIGTTVIIEFTTL